MSAQPGAVRPYVVVLRVEGQDVCEERGFRGRERGEQREERLSVVPVGGGEGGLVEKKWEAGVGVELGGVGNALCFP